MVIIGKKSLPDIFRTSGIITCYFVDASYLAYKINKIICYHRQKYSKCKINKNTIDSKERDYISQKLKHYNFLVSFWKSMISTYNLQ